MKRHSARAALWALLAVWCLAAAGCRAEDPPSERLTVLAAASLREPFEAARSRFEAGRPGLKVALSFGGSAQLAAQLAHGAPADVFASADEAQMAAAVAAGRVAPGAVRIFARNRLVIAAAAGGPVQAPADLARPRVRVVMADGAVPAGRYAHAFLDRAALAYGYAYKHRVLANVVSYEADVRAVLAKVQLGEADAGFVYATDLAAARRGAVVGVVIPEALNPEARYAAAPVEGAAHAEAAEAFVGYLLSDEGQAALRQAGFLPPP